MRQHTSHPTPPPDTAFLTFANIETAIALHLDSHATMIDAQTRRLLADLRDAAGAQALRLRAAAG